MADENPAFKRAKLDKYSFRSLKITAKSVFYNVGIGQNVTDLCLAAVKAHMDLSKQVSPDKYSLPR